MLKSHNKKLDSLNMDVVFYVLKTKVNCKDLLMHKSLKNDYFEKAFTIMSKLYSKKVHYMELVTIQFN
jgi:hypothetical protein